MPSLVAHPVLHTTVLHPCVTGCQPFKNLLPAPPQAPLHCIPVACNSLALDSPQFRPCNCPSVTLGPFKLSPAALPKKTAPLAIPRPLQLANWPPCSPVFNPLPCSQRSSGPPLLQHYPKASLEASSFPAAPPFSGHVSCLAKTDPLAAPPPSISCKLAAICSCMAQVAQSSSASQMAPPFAYTARRQLQLAFF
ncbi:hypothetical protein GOP47_0024367 [Adiantum capillus-veneris]|uniref:Uncharacterized protein n=1 Tax=Adiantum capillus-veneris TaxID=13818 RepID=A0A9D4Z4B5_ADICA|nr:hypothetical protein GOP47_0024367 [Adiantum capillus-veneris]